MTLAEKIAALAALLRDVEVAASTQDSRIRELEAENAHLRKGLQMIADLPDADSDDRNWISRNALNGWDL